jgi:hypothetical protein
MVILLHSGHSLYHLKISLSLLIEFCNCEISSFFHLFSDSVVFSFGDVFGKSTRGVVCLVCCRAAKQISKLKPVRVVYRLVLERSRLSHFLGRLLLPTRIFLVLRFPPDIQN